MKLWVVDLCKFVCDYMDSNNEEMPPSSDVWKASRIKALEDVLTKTIDDIKKELEELRKEG